MNKDKITGVLNQYGLSEVGFCAFETVKEHLLNCRAKQRIPENAKSIIIFLFPYKVKNEKPKNISRYAAVPDYHRVTAIYFEKIISELINIFPQNKFEAFCDNSPIPEVYTASCAGLGVIGENGLLINKRYGSWCFIGEIITDLKITSKNSPEKCPFCGNCKKACPRGDYETDCLSAVSQRKKELSKIEMKALFDNNIIWGCDICADVCPLNKNTELTNIKEFIEGYRDGFVSGENITGRAYEWRGKTPVERNSIISANKVSDVIDSNDAEKK